MPFDRKSMVARYYELCDLRDAAYAVAQTLETQLDQANQKVIEAQEEARKLAAQIEEVWAGASEDGTVEGWLALKKEIADIARFFVRVPPRPTEELTESRKA